MWTRVCQNQRVRALSPSKKRPMKAGRQVEALCIRHLIVFTGCYHGAGAAQSAYTHLMQQVQTPLGGLSESSLWMYEARE